MLQVANALTSQNVRTFGRGSEEYERSVATANLLYRFSRPDLVVQPETVAQVQAVVNLARENKIKLTIKCGGHSYAGHSTAFEGISLDLCRLRFVRLALDAAGSPQTVTFGAGCQWGHVYKALVNGQYNGFVINGGRCPYVGVGGFLLGGGLGSFSRSIGMGCDTLKEATVVTADGKVVTVSETDEVGSDKGELFWALRGAGGGNFGVVVEMKMAVTKLQTPNLRVVAGRFQWFGSGRDLMDAPDFMQTMTKFYTTNWPERITIDSTWICDLRLNSGNGVRFLTYFDGTKDEFDNIIDQNISNIELKKQLKRRSLPELSTRFLHETLVAQWSEETQRAFPKNATYSIYSSFVLTRKQQKIEAVTALIKAKIAEFRAQFPGERVAFLATFIHAGGKMSAPRRRDTAFRWRSAVYHMYLTVEWEDKWMERDMRAFLNAAKQDLRPYSLSSKAAFINFPDAALPPDSHERAYFGNNTRRLRRVKKTWDAGGFFSGPQGVQLPSAGGTTPQPPADGPMRLPGGPMRFPGGTMRSVPRPATSPEPPFSGGDDDDDDEEINVGNDEDLTDTFACAHWESYAANDFPSDF